jgi:hypothetical protein
MGDVIKMKNPRSTLPITTTSGPMSICSTQEFHPSNIPLNPNDIQPVPNSGAGTTVGVIASEISDDGTGIGAGVVSGIVLTGVGEGSGIDAGVVSGIVSTDVGAGAGSTTGVVDPDVVSVPATTEGSDGD